MTKTVVAHGKAQQKRKWIDDRIESLDPEVDHVEIVRLSTLYRVNPLQMHWFYTVGTAAAGIAPAVMDAVYRDGTGTYTVQPNKRRDDSNDHMMLWFEHGPDAAATRRSVQMINKYHAHFARSHPDGFADPEDYVYIICMNATLVHNAERLVGMPGFSPRQKRAMHRFWAGIADQFTTSDGRPVTSQVPFPEDFAAMERLVQAYQARPWPVHPPGHLSTTSAIENFVVSWFPRPLRFLGRAMVTSFLPPSVRRAHAIAPARPPLAWLALNIMKTMMWLSTHVLPDPAESLPDKRRRLAAAGEAAPSLVDNAVHRGLGRTGSSDDSVMSSRPLGCPHFTS